MKIRGRFTVSCDPETAFEVLVGACGELKAKVQDIDALQRRIEGRSKTTAWRWGTKFRARVIKRSESVMIEVYDVALATDDRFIKKLYETFTRYQPASPLEIGSVEDLGDRPLPAEPLSPVGTGMIDAAGKPAPGCPNCGKAPEEGMSFCTKCGTKLVD